MPTITKSIGTTGRDYSTITLWEADLDNAGIYASGDDAVGECYNDSAFDESFTSDGGVTVGLASATLTVAAGQRHDGTAGTGARIVATAARSIVLAVDAVVRKIQWLEIDHNDLSGGICNIGGQGNQADWLLVHGGEATANQTWLGFNFSGTASPEATIKNSILYDCRTSGGSNSNTNGVGLISGSRQRRLFNVTVHNIANVASGALNTFGVNITDTSHYVVQNVVVTGTSAVSGPVGDFNPAAPTGATVNHNASSDATASGTGSLTSIVTADQYVSTVVGSEDLHLKVGSDCIDAGIDIGTTPAGVNIDIDGRDRDTEGDTWDIGADEFVAVAPPPAVPLESLFNRGLDAQFNVGFN